MYMISCAIYYDHDGYGALGTGALLRCGWATQGSSRFYVFRRRTLYYARFLNSQGKIRFDPTAAQARSAHSKSSNHQAKLLPFLSASVSLDHRAHRTTRYIGQWRVLARRASASPFPSPHVARFYPRPHKVYLLETAHTSHTSFPEFQPEHGLFLEKPTSI